MEPSPVLAAFVERVLAEPALEQRLAECTSGESLRHACREVALARGWPLDETEIPPLLQARFLRWHQRHLG